MKVVLAVLLFPLIGLAQNCASTDPNVHLTQEDCDRMLPQLTPLGACTDKNVSNEKYIAALKKALAAQKESAEAYKHLADVYNKALCATVAALKPAIMPEYCAPAAKPKVKK